MIYLFRTLVQAVRLLTAFAASPFLVASVDVYVDSTSVWLEQAMRVLDLRQPGVRQVQARAAA